MTGVQIHTPIIDSILYTKTMYSRSGVKRSHSKSILLQNKAISKVCHTRAFSVLELHNPYQSGLVRLCWFQQTDYNFKTLNYNVPKDIEPCFHLETCHSQLDNITDIRYL